MTIKPWPDNDETVRFDEMVEPVCDAIRKAYKFEFRGFRDIEWDGLDIGEETKVGSLDPGYRLTEKMLRYDDESQGRDPLCVIVGLAVQLGIEQGRRIERKRSRSERDLLAILSRILDNA